MSKPFELAIAEYYPQNAYPIYSGSEEELEKTLDFMDATIISTAHNYNLLFKIRRTIEKTLKLDILFTNAMMSVLFSPKSMNILNEICPEQFQVFDTVICCKDGDVTEYKAIKILNYYDVSDPGKSRYEYYSKSLDPDGSISGYTRGRCVFKDQPMEPLHIARDTISHSTIIISATLKNALEKAKIRGCRYWPGDESKD